MVAYVIWDHAERFESDVSDLVGLKCPSSCLSGILPPGGYEDGRLRGDSPKQKNNAGYSNWLDYQAHNLKVAGSNPVPANSKNKR